MNYLTFLLAILHVQKALGEEIFWDTTVKLTENMILECAYPLTETLTQLEWFKIIGMQKDPIGIFSPAFGVQIRKPYADRVYYVNSTMAPNVITLSFYNASEADLGIYSCFFHIFPHGTWEKTTRVIQADSFEIAASLNGPMRPITSEIGQNVTLTYLIQMKGPVQQVTWEKIQAHQIDILTCCNLSQGRTYTSKYQRQVWSNCSQGIRVSHLVIPHAIASDSGVYRCCVKDSTGESETFMMRLTLTEGETNNQHIPFVAGGTVLLLLVILIIVIIVIFYNRRRRRLINVPFQESWDTQSKITNNFRSAMPTNQAMDDAKEDIYVNYPTLPRRPRLRD